MTTTVALLFGGRSGEHGISCITAGGVLGAIDREKYHVIAVGVTREGRYVQVSDDPADWTLVDGRAPEVSGDGPEVLLPAVRHSAGEPIELRVIRDGHVEPLARIDAVFPLLHGSYGEDGTIQGALDLLDVPYVGSGVLASAMSMDKATTKLVLTTAGLTCAPGLVVHQDRWEQQSRSVMRHLRESYPLPWFVKPSRAGSSLGVTRVGREEELEPALREAFAEDPKVLIEQAVAGREVECGVLQGADGGPPRTTLPGEVRVGEDLEFYDYGSKYFGKGTIDIEIPAKLPDRVLEEVRHVSAAAFEALGLEGLARVDVFVTPENTVIVNEVNTMPGFTPYSMFPVLWQNMGVDYTALITDLVEQALARRIGLR